MCVVVTTNVTLPRKLTRKFFYELQEYLLISCTLINVY
jgi:hypothetical protein